MIIHLLKRKSTLGLALIFLFATGYSAAASIIQAEQQDENKKLLL
jgi:hypothetical protein